MSFKIESLIKEKLLKWSNAELALLPTPMHPLKNFGKFLNNQERGTLKPLTV